MALKSFAGGKVFARIYGSQPPRVVALHGWGRTGSDFDLVLTGLDALAADLPGFGSSPPPTERMGAAGYAEAVTCLLEGGPAVVVGHSFGGRVAVALADRHPELVRGLVLSGVPLVRREAGRSPSASFRILRRLHRLGLVSNERMERERRRRGSADYRAVSGVMRDVLVTAVNESYEELLARLRVPVSMVWGDRDREVPVAVAERALELIRSAGVTASLDVVDGAGHLLPVEAPDPLRAAIDLRLGS